MRELILEKDVTEGEPFSSFVPFTVYLNPFVDGCRVQFTAPKETAEYEESDWQDYPAGTITQSRPLIPVCGGDDIIFRLKATTAGAEGIKSIPQADVRK